MATQETGRDRNALSYSLLILFIPYYLNIRPNPSPQNDKMKDMDDRMSTMKEELMNDREDAEDRLVKKIKLDKAPTIKKKAHEKQ